LTSYAYQLKYTIATYTFYISHVSVLQPIALDSFYVVLNSVHSNNANLRYYLQNNQRL